MFSIHKVMRQQTKDLFLQINQLNEVSEWRLVGGTALSLHIEHRISEDLDFFTNGQSIDKKISKNIDAILHQLEKKGAHIELFTNDENQRDYLINGVKTTFHTVDDINLLSDENSSFFESGNICIASEEMLSAMKMKTILKHRTKSRDFYDVYKLIDTGRYNFTQLLENMQKYYPKSFFSEKLIESRFLKAPLNVGDEGLESVVTNDITDFQKIREYFKKIIKDIHQKDNEIVSNATSSKNFTACNDRKYGLNLSTLAIYLAKHGDIDTLKALLESNEDLKVNDTNLSGENLLQILVTAKEHEAFDMVLRGIDFIPDKTSEQIALLPQNEAEPFVKSINYQRLINRCLKYFPDENDKISTIIKDKNVASIEQFFADLYAKKTALEEKGLCLSEIAKSYDSATHGASIKQFNEEQKNAEGRLTL